MLHPRHMFFVLLVLLLASCRQEEEERGPVVLAASSTIEAMQEVADYWQAKGHARPVMSFASSATLARQIQRGAPADVFLSADEAWMNELERDGLLRPGTRRDLLGNTLVLISGPAARSPVRWDGSGPIGAVVEGGRIAIADAESVPAGRYARAILESRDEWEDLRDSTVSAESVRAALALVERGQAEFGIVYRTDSLASPGVSELGAFTPLADLPIHYPVAVIDSGTHNDAEAFVSFLASTEGRAIFARYGFEPLS